MPVSSEVLNAHERIGLELERARLDWLSANPDCVMSMGRQWYYRQGYGYPNRRAESLRDAIDKACALKERRKRE
jgi:hypothetical protein